MKLLSSLPALIAKITDLVDRTVTSDIEVLQQTFFPLLRFSGPVRPTPASVNVLTQSGIVTIDSSVPMEISVATGFPSPPMRAARMKALEAGGNAASRITDASPASPSQAAPGLADDCQSALRVPKHREKRET